MKTAHWARVAAAIRARYDIPHSRAKAIYDLWRKRAGRAPSLRMVRAAPAKPPRIRAVTPAQKAAPVKKTAPVKKAVLVKKAVPVKQTASGSKAVPVKKTALGSKVVPVKKTVTFEEPPLPDLPPKAAPRADTGLAPRNKYERLLAKNRIPVILGRTPLGRNIAKLWRHPDIHVLAVREYKACLWSVKNLGFIPDPVRDRVKALVVRVFMVSKEKFDIEAHYWQWLRECYDGGSVK